MGRNKWKCLDCKVDTGKIGEHYFINTNTWLSVVGSNQGMLCVECLEARLNRRLNSKDFTNCYLNRDGNKSLRLLSRIQK